MTDDKGEAGRSFDLVAARQTLRLLQLAHDRWSETYAGLADMRFEGENSREEVSLRVRGPAVETTMWVRALDDWCRGLPGQRGPMQPVLTGYEDQRAELEGLLDGARYVTNRSLHQLLALMWPTGVMRFPLRSGNIFNTFAGVFWLPEGRLGSVSSENARQRSLRESYVEHMAEKEVGPTLDCLRDFFEAVFAPRGV
jgi:hypothetical protein